MSNSGESIFMFGPFVPKANSKEKPPHFPKQPFSSPNKAANILYYRLPDPPSNWYLPIASLDATDIVKVFQKMNPVSFTRLRKSCRAMDHIAERYRKHIGIQLRRINIDPARFFYRIWPHMPAIDQFRNVEDKLASSDEMLFQICPTFSDYAFEMKLSEASRRLSGFTFEKVIVGEDFGNDQSSLSLMSPQVLEDYMNFVRTQCWRTNAVLLNHTPMEIWKIFKPKMVNTSHLQALPKSVKTIVTGIPQNRALLDVREIPRWVENLLLVDEYQSLDYCNIAKDYVEFVGRIAKAFYADQLFVPYIQIKKTAIYKRILLEYLNRTQLSDSRAAEACLLHYLKTTPFSGSVTQSFYGEIDRFCINCKSKRITWVGTSNAILTSRTGRKGLLAVRIEPQDCDDISYEVSIYFWKDQLDFLMPTEKYLEKDSDGIKVPKLQTYMKGICIDWADFYNDESW